MGSRQQQSARFRLPLAPSVNRAYADVVKHTRAGKAYPKRIATQALETFKSDAPYLLYQQGLIRGTWEGAQAVGYAITVYTPNDRSDLSNRLKAYEDAVTQYLGFDDHLIREGSFKKVIDASDPRIEGHWYTIDEEE